MPERGWVKDIVRKVSQIILSVDKVKHILDQKAKLEVVADKGYYNGEKIRECERVGIVADIAKPRTSPNKAVGITCLSAIQQLTGGLILPADISARPWR